MQTKQHAKNKNKNKRNKKKTTTTKAALKFKYTQNIPGFIFCGGRDSTKNLQNPQFLLIQ